MLLHVLKSSGSVYVLLCYDLKVVVILLRGGNYSRLACNSYVLLI